MYYPAIECVKEYLPTPVAAEMDLKAAVRPLKYHLFQESVPEHIVTDYIHAYNQKLLLFTLLARTPRGQPKNTVVDEAF
jgi:hypothetical protein